MSLEKVITQDKIEIKGYEGLYAVTSDGRVWSHPKGTNSREGNWMSLDCYGRYPVVCLTKLGQAKRHLVHRLVAGAFISNPNERSQVNHINGIRTDNQVENLEWVTASENRLHAWREGLQTATALHKDSARKAGYRRRLFSMDQASDIRESYKAKELNQYELADKYGTSQAVINGIILHKTYTKEAA